MGGFGGAPPSSFLILVKKFLKKIVGGGIFHFWGVGGITPPKKIVINLPGTYEKLPYNLKRRIFSTKLDEGKGN